MSERLPELSSARAPAGLFDEALERRQGRDRRRREHRRIGGAAAVALLIGAFGGWFAGSSSGSSVPPAPPPTPSTTLVLAAPDAAPPDTVSVRFVYHAPDARQVAIAGTFNGWNPEKLPMIRGRDGVFYAIVELPRGRHEYMLVVDGEWLVDPAAPMSIDDGFGRRNGVLEV